MDFCVLVANIVGIGHHRRRSMGVVIPLFHHSIPLFHSTIPFHRSIPPNKDSHTNWYTYPNTHFAWFSCFLFNYLSSWEKCTFPRMNTHCISKHGCNWLIFHYFYLHQRKLYLVELKPLKVHKQLENLHVLSVPLQCQHQCAVLMHNFFTKRTNHSGLVVRVG